MLKQEKKKIITDKIFEFSILVYKMSFCKSIKELINIKLLFKGITMLPNINYLDVHFKIRYSPNKSLHF